MATHRSSRPARPSTRASTRKPAQATTDPWARYRIQSLDRAAAILGCFLSEGPELTVRDVSARTRLHKSTAHRILMALQCNGFIEHDEVSGRYHLGLQLVKLGEHAVGRLDVRVIARPFVVDLSAETGETVLMAVMDGDQVVVLDRVDGAKSATTPSLPGRLFPAHCTALGKAMLAGLADAELTRLLGRRQLKRFTARTVTAMEALLADLRDIRRRGYAIADEEMGADLGAVGAPVRNHTGAVVAAISVVGPSARLHAIGLDRLGAQVKAVADRVSARLGHAPPDPRRLPASRPRG
jgi:DNA-binding IclR family transcriptional regulator